MLLVPHAAEPSRYLASRQSCSVRQLSEGQETPMSLIPPGTRLGRDDVIGRKLIDVLQSGTIVENDMEWVYTFFRIDSGAVFCLPFADAGGLVVEEPRSDCTSRDYPELKPVFGQRIVNVFRDGPDAECCLDSPYLIMDNGYVITDVMGYPEGPGRAGLYIYAPGHIDTSKMIDFFS
jgi:hypothetical protein